MSLFNQSQNIQGFEFDFFMFVLFQIIYLPKLVISSLKFT